MSAKIIDGKKIADGIRQEIHQEILELKRQGIIPGLSVIIVGKSNASQIYVKNKRGAAEELGINSQVYELEESTTQEELLRLIDKLNKDDSVHGVLVQLPLPKNINEKIIISAVDPQKDVDGFHPLNIGKMIIGEKSFLPCTPAGIVELIKKCNIKIAGKNCVVVGRSSIVGKPAAFLMLQNNATVTICHSKTKDIKTHCLGADILIVAVGKAGMVTADMIKPGATVIDVGINRTEGGRLVGDVDFEKVKEIAGAITPVPGGVGPMTIAMLLRNTVLAAKTILN